MVSDAGFLAAVTVQAGLVSAGANRLLLPRIEVTPDYDGVVRIDRYLSASPARALEAMFPPSSSSARSQNVEMIRGSWLTMIDRVAAGAQLAVALLAALP